MGVRQKLKVCPELSENKLSESVFLKFCTLSAAQTAKENVQRHHFVEPGGGGKLRVIDGSHSL
jgi:hypothetical protein